MQNEIGILEFIHAFVETMDKYFDNVVRGRRWAVSAPSNRPFPTLLPFSAVRVGHHVQS